MDQIPEILTWHAIKCQAYLPDVFNPLNAIFHLLALLGAHHILHISRIRVKVDTSHFVCYTQNIKQLIKFKTYMT
jgi:hypothetical protein